MNRRASLPGADELFRTTSDADGPTSPRRTDPSRRTDPLRRTDPSRPEPEERAPVNHRPPTADATPEASGRVRHDQKITVYLTGQELLDIEQARLRLRAEFDLAVDRGRIVREAVSELLQDLHEHGPDAAIVRRLS